MIMLLTGVGTATIAEGRRRYTVRYERCPVCDQPAYVTRRPGEPPLVTHKSSLR